MKKIITDQAQWDDLMAMITGLGWCIYWSKDKTVNRAEFPGLMVAG
jgi:hypothetical protein